jgi:hypothetical protein
MVYRGKLLFYQKNYGLLRTLVLRIMFLVISFLKLLAWCVVLPFPRLNDRAKKEIRSNWDVMGLCWNLK